MKHSAERPMSFRFTADLTMSLMTRTAESYAALRRALPDGGAASRRRRDEISRRLVLAFEGAASGMALTAPDGRYLSVNRALCEITGYSEGELLARRCHDITHPGDLAIDVEHQRALLDGAVDRYETETRYVHRDGREVWVGVAVIAARGEGGEILCLISEAHGLTKREIGEHEPAHRGLHDSLTGLPNRGLFLDRLRHALVRSRRGSGEVAILFVDIDRFKLVNDGMGHSAGDAVLQDTAKRLSAAARAGDTVARFGADGFTMICEGADKEQASQMAARVLEALARPFAIAGREVQLSASVGVRAGEVAAGTPESLLRDAEVALRTAKQRGGTRVEIFDPNAAAGIDVLASEQALRLAMRRGELCLHYQPEIDLATQRIIAVEALVRWQHPERGLVAPGEFIPVAEASGLIVEMGEWVLREACSQLAAWRREGTVDESVTVAVNVSARQLSDPDLPSAVSAALANAGLGARALCVEVTESAIINDPDVALANLSTIKRQGASIALDDFGVGFSSLSQIRDLPAIDVIKLDRSFVAGLGGNESDIAVVSAVLSLTRSLGVTAVAEGVEREIQLGLLQRLGCAVGQGFYFARPQPPAAIEQVLRQGTTLEARISPISFD